MTIDGLVFEEITEVLNSRMLIIPHMTLVTGVKDLERATVSG